MLDADKQQQLKNTRDSHMNDHHLCPDATPGATDTAACDPTDRQSGSAVLEYGLVMAGMSLVLLAFFNQSGTGLSTLLKQNYASVGAQIANVNQQFQSPN